MSLARAGDVAGVTRGIGCGFGAAKKIARRCRNARRPFVALARRSTAMRKLIVHEFVTLDGVMQAPGGPDEDRDGGFTHGGWTRPYWHDEIGAHFGALM